MAKKSNKSKETNTLPKGYRVPKDALQEEDRKEELENMMRWYQQSTNSKIKIGGPPV